MPSLLKIKAASNDGPMPELLIVRNVRPLCQCAPSHNSHTCNNQLITGEIIESGSPNWHIGEDPVWPAMGVHWHAVLDGAVLCVVPVAQVALKLESMDREALN